MFLSWNYLFEYLESLLISSVLYFVSKLEKITISDGNVSLVCSTSLFGFPRKVIEPPWPYDLARVPGWCAVGDSQLPFISIIIIINIQRFSRGSELPEKGKKRQTHQDSNLGPCL